jgi:hypothetical protein
MTLTKVYGLVEIQEFAAHLLVDTSVPPLYYHSLQGAVILYNDNQVMVYFWVSAPCSCL